jgi:hypothetical protein
MDGDGTTFGRMIGFWAQEIVDGPLKANALHNYTVLSVVRSAVNSSCDLACEF